MRVVPVQYKSCCNGNEFRKISDAAVGHTLVDIFVADPTRRDLVERAAIHDLVAVTDAKRRKKAHYRDRAAGTKFVPLSSQSSSCAYIVQYRVE